MRPDHFTDYEQPEPEAFRLLCRACPLSAKWIEDRTGPPSGFAELSSRDAPFEAIPGKKEGGDQSTLATSDSPWARGLCDATVRAGLSFEDADLDFLLTLPEAPYRQ